MKVVCESCSTAHEIEPPAWVLTSGRSFDVVCPSCRSRQRVAVPAAVGSEGSARRGGRLIGSKPRRPLPNTLPELAPDDLQDGHHAGALHGTRPDTAIAPPISATANAAVSDAARASALQSARAEVSHGGQPASLSQTLGVTPAAGVRPSTIQTDELLAAALTYDAIGGRRDATLVDEPVWRGSATPTPSHNVTLDAADPLAGELDVPYLPPGKDDWDAGYEAATHRPDVTIVDEPVWRGASGAAPEPPRDPSAPWMLAQDGRAFRVQDLATLQRWIIERRVNRHDLLSEEGSAWIRVDSRPDLAVFFAAVERLEAMETQDSAPEPPPASPPRPPPLVPPRPDRDWLSNLKSLDEEPEVTAESPSPPTEEMPWRAITEERRDPVRTPPDPIEAPVRAPLGLHAFEVGPSTEAATELIAERHTPRTAVTPPVTAAPTPATVVPGPSAPTPAAPASTERSQDRIPVLSSGVRAPAPVPAAWRRWLEPAFAGMIMAIGTLLLYQGVASPGAGGSPASPVELRIPRATFDPTAKADEAWRAFEAGDPSAALALAQEVLAVEPTHVRATYIAGLATHQLGRYLESRNHLCRVLGKLSPDDEARARTRLSASHQVCPAQAPGTPTATVSP